jgi:hypothetical protein
MKNAAASMATGWCVRKANIIGSGSSLNDGSEASLSRTVLTNTNPLREAKNKGIATTRRSNFENLISVSQLDPNITLAPSFGVYQFMRLVEKWLPLETNLTIHHYQRTCSTQPPWDGRCLHPLEQQIPSRCSWARIIRAKLLETGLLPPLLAGSQDRRRFRNF